MHALEINNLFYTYPDQTPALKGINFKLKKAKKTALLGTNGSGKTTLIYHLNGLIKAQQGQVKVDGEVIDKKNLKNIRRTVGMLFDNPDNQLFSTTVEQDISFGPRNLHLPEEEVTGRIQKIAELLNITGLLEKPPFSLSLGQKKRVAIAGLLTMDPKVLVCDEPFSGLDPTMASQFRALLDALIAEGKTLLYSTHDVNLAYSWADEVVLIKEGTLLATGPVKLLQDEKLMQAAGLEQPALARIFGHVKDGPRSVEEAERLMKKTGTLADFF